MANTYKNIIITPNIGNTADPKIDFQGGNTSVNSIVSLFVYPDANGTLSFEGSAGQLFSITNDLSNSLFAVSDVSGIPSLEIFANGLVSAIPYGGNVVFGNSTASVLVNSTAFVGNVFTTTINSTTVNAATFQVGTAFTANSTLVNAVSYYAGSLLVANTTVINSTHFGGIVPAGYLRSNVVSATLSGTIVSNNNANVDGPNFEVNTTSKSTAEYAYKVSRTGVVAGGILIDGRGSFANTTVTGFINVTSTGQFGGAVSGITTLATGNTTITGFANVTTSVNANSFSVGTSYTANSTVVNAVSYYAGTLLVANTTVINATHLGGKTEGNLNVNNATQLATTRTINGVNFNGTANILVPSLYDTNYRRITNPGGAEYTTTTSSITGAISITLPVGWSDSMVRMTVRVYEYTTDKSFDIICGGYNYVVGTTWLNTFAYILGDKDVDRRFSVRFGYTAGGKCVIYIGELASTWSYPQVFVTDVQIGFTGQSATWVSGWTIGFQASAFETVTSTVTSTQIGYGTSTSTADALVLRDASSNFSANNITANTTGIHTGNVAATTITASANLMVGSLLVANTTVINATHLAGKTEGNLNVNNSVFMNGNNVVSVMENLRANRNINGGGTITVDASYNVVWSTRFIVISNGRGTHFSTTGYFDITCPTSGTITGVGGAANRTATAAGIPLGAWEALYYILPIGSTNTSLAANFRVVNYTADVEIPSDWILICIRNGEAASNPVSFPNGINLLPGQSYNTAIFSSSVVPTANNATNLGGTAAASYVQNTDSRTLSGNLNFTGSNTTVNAIFRVVNATANVLFAGANGNIGIGNNTPIHTLRVTGTTSLAGAVSDITTLAAGNTTITGFVNATSSVNAASYTIGTTLIANTLGVYHTGIVNAASHTVGASLVANTTGVYHTGTVNAAIVSSTNATFTRVTDIYQAAGDLRANLGNPSVEEKALFHGQFDNKFRFIAPTSQEESTDGITWTASSRATSAQLGDLMVGQGQGTSFNAIPSGTVGTADYYRLTWNVYATTAYVYLNHLYIYCSTQGNQVNFKIEALNNITAVWDTIASGTSSGWPGHFSIKHTTIPYHTTVQAGFYAQVRVTFTVASRTNTNSVQLYAIEWFGGYPQGRRNAESYDRLKNVTFPANVTATGALTVGSTFTANATLVNAAALNVTGQVNTATLYATTSANIASVVQANALGLFTTGLVSATTFEIGGSGITDTTISRAGAGIISVEGGIVPKENRLNTFTQNQTLSNATLLITGNSGTTSFITLENIGTTGRSQIYFMKSRDFLASVAADDIIGQLSFWGSDGTTNVIAGSITATVDGTPGTSDMPGRLTFATTPDGGSSAAEHMRITASGNVGIGNTAPDAKLAVTGTANVSANVRIGGTTTLAANVVLGTTTITANGGVGTAGQVLSSGATGNAYWATPLIKGGAIGSIDFNAERARASGIYSVDVAPTNGPPSSAYSNYIQMTERGDTSAQIVVDYSTGYIYSRGIQTATPTYSAWRTNLNDGNIGSYAVRGTVRLTVSTTAPGSPATNDLWVDTN
jgi:hypothetical protein